MSRILLRPVFASLGLGFVAPASVRAQGWGEPPVSSNYARAYQHFLTSPYSYRTFSSLSPGYVTSGYTPYGYQTTAVGPGYTHQRITPRGFEAYTLAPGYTATTVRPPVLIPAYPPPYAYPPPGPYLP